MDDNKVKEKISEAFIRLLMAKNRMTVTKPEDDYGIDFEVGRVQYNQRHSGKRLTMNPSRKIGIQLKCTTLNGVELNADGGYKYDLSVKNYENIVRSRDETPSLQKTILIVFILPENESEWLMIEEDKIFLSKHAFWYYPPDTDTLEKTMGKKLDSTTRIELRAINRMGIDFEKIFDILYDT